MSVRCISQVLDKSIHSGTDLLLLVILADYSDDEGNSYPAVASLARKCRMTPRNVNYILKNLQTSGELRLLRNDGPRGTNRYRIVLTALGLNAPLKPIAPLKGASPLKPISPTPEAHFPEPLKSTSDEPSLNRQEPSSPDRNALSGFDKFWAAYPKRVGKQDAMKAFKTSKVSNILGIVLTDIECKIQSGKWKETDTQFIPNPATYLRGRRWEDEDADMSGHSQQTLIPGAI